MQAATCFVQPLFPSKNVIFVSSPSKTPTFLTTSRSSAIKASSFVACDSLSVNYNSPFSVFPAEACEIIGGDACKTDICPEVKLDDQPKMMSQNNTTEQFDREYFDYNSDPKSVLQGEACDALGGEFCEDPYMEGVY